MKKIINHLRYFKKNFNASVEQHPALAKSLKNLENRLYGVIDFLKNTSIKIQEKKFELNDLPWYLLIGSEGVGKTTLLANSGIKFILNKKFSSEELKSIPPSENCDWWVTANAVLVDIPGSYTIYKDNVSSESNRLLQHFLHLIQKIRGRRGINGLIVTISLTELMDQNSREQLIQNLQHHIAELNAKFGSLPIYFAITKSDLLPGFLEFFADYGSDELTQAWGVSIPVLEQNESLLEVFTYRFNQLIKRLNEQLIWRLHQERNPYTKLFVKDFPLHVERFKEAFIDLLKKCVAEKTTFNLKGVYLTSAIQHQEEEDINPQTQIVMANSFQQSLAIMQNPMLPGQAYFIKQFILHGLGNSDLTSNTKNFWRNNVIYALFASIIITLVMSTQSNQFFSVQWTIVKQLFALISRAFSAGPMN